jgi:hypothetical protein
MSLILEPRVFRIRVLQQAYAALQKDLPYLEERTYLLRVIVSEYTIHYSVKSHVDTSLLDLFRHDLGSALYERYLHLRELDDLKQGERHLRLSLPDHFPAAYVSGSACLLGSILREHAYQTSSMELIEEALSLHRGPLIRPDACATTLQQAHCSRELGLTLLIHHYIESDVAVLRESVRRLKDAQTLFADVHTTDHISCVGLCRALNSLSYMQPERSSMEDGISYGTLALTLCGPAHRDLYSATHALINLQVCFSWDFDDTDSLENAISLGRAALVSAPPRWARKLTTYFIRALIARSMRPGHEDHLSEAITHTTSLLDNSSPTDEEWTELQDLLARSLHVRFNISGLQEDIEAAAHAANLSISGTSSTSSLYPTHLGVLAAFRAEQYLAFGDVTHLEECISILERTCQITAAHSNDWMQAGSNLLESYHLRFKATGDVIDLDRATNLSSALMPLQRESASFTPFILYHAGHAFLSRFVVNGTLDDLEQATTLHREASTYNSNSTHYGCDARIAYAATLRVRYEVLHEENSGAQALELQSQVVEELSEVHPSRPEAMCSLARLRLCVDPNAAHIAEALDLLLDALNSNYCPAYRRLKSVTDVLKYLAAQDPVLSHQNALRLSLVYSTTIDLLPQVASFGLGPRARLAVIAGAGQLTIQGSIHAILIGRLDLALEMLEAGRNVFWTQGLHLRTPFTDLPKAVGDRLTKITSALAQPPLEGYDKDRELSRRRKLGEEFRTVLIDARLEPGFEHLLKNASFQSLVKAAERHPLVVFLASEVSGHAVIVFGDSRCRRVELPGANIKTLRVLSLRIEKHTSAVRDSRGMKMVGKLETRPTAVDAYRELWALIMSSIVDALEWPVSITEAPPTFRELTIVSDGARTRAETTHSLSNGHIHAATAPRSRCLHRKQPSVLLRLLRGVVHPVHRGTSPCPAVIPARAPILRHGDAGRGCGSTVSRRSASRSHQGGHHRSGARLALQDFSSVDHEWRARAHPGSLDPPSCLSRYSESL